MSQNNETVQVFLHPLWGLFAILVIGVPLFFLWSQAPTIIPEHYGQAPSFRLSNQQNQPVSTESLKGKMTVVNFIFTRCPNICPTLTARMAALQDQIPAETASFVSITVDPTYDSPEILYSYAQRFEADHSRWYFLRGTEKETHEVIAGFQQAYEVVTGESDIPTILHSEKFILVDKNASIRGFFDDDPDGTNQLLRAIEALEEE